MRPCGTSPSRLKIPQTAMLVLKVLRWTAMTLGSLVVGDMKVNLRSWPWIMNAFTFTQKCTRGVVVPNLPFPYTDPGMLCHIIKIAAYAASPKFKRLCVGARPGSALCCPWQAIWRLGKHILAITDHNMVQTRGQQTLVICLQPPPVKSGS